MTTIYPGGLYKPLGPQTQARLASHDLVVLHTMVGYLTSTDRLFRAAGYAGLESHFGVGGRWGPDAAAGLDGNVWQWQDLDYQADANLAGNHRIISVETADNAPGAARDIQPWTPAQVEAIAHLLAWLHGRYDIPLVLVPDSKPGRRGVAYHRLGIDPWRVAGGEQWSTSRGKECPGNARIKQVPTVIARARQIAAGRTNEEDDVTPEQAQDIAERTGRVVARYQNGTNARVRALVGTVAAQGKVLGALAQGQTAAQADLDALQTQLADLESVVAGIVDVPEPSA